MKNKTHPTYKFPKRIQEEYMMLMSSKDHFLKKVTSAEARNLENLYDQLKESWGQNRTEQLNKILNQKYEELRKLQKELSQNWQVYETNTADQELKDIKNGEIALKNQKALFTPKLQTWKEDTMKRDIELKKKSELLKNKQRELEQISEPSNINPILKNLLEQNKIYNEDLKTSLKIFHGNKMSYNNHLKEIKVSYKLKMNANNKVLEENLRLAQLENNKLKMIYNKNSLPYQMTMNENYRNQSEVLIQLEKELKEELLELGKKEIPLVKSFEENKTKLNLNYLSKLKEQKEQMTKFEKTVSKSSIMVILKEHSLIKMHMKEFLSSKSLSNCIQTVSKFSIELTKKINNKLAPRGISLVEFCIEEGIEVLDSDL